MPQSGPSKEELENYYKNSRAYFDELAKYYYEADREYYNEYIAPFYSPFMRVSSGGKSSAARAVLISAVLVAVALAGAVALFLTAENEGDNTKDEKRIEDIKEKKQKDTDEKKINKDTSSVKKKKTLSNYEKGVEYFNQQNFSRAEEYLRKVSKDDENYDDAQTKLKEIYEFKGKDDDRRYVKPRPIERTR